MDDETPLPHQGRRRLWQVLAVLVVLTALAYAAFWKFYLDAPVEPELTLPPLASTIFLAPFMRRAARPVSFPQE